MEAAIKYYFRFNQTAEDFPSIVWVAHKTVIRGHIISLSSQLKAAQKAKINKLTADYRAAAKAHNSLHTADSLQTLDKTRTLLNLALTTAAEKHLRWTGAKFYYQTDRLGSRLAAKLNPKHCALAFPKIKMTSGDLTQNSTKIMEAFSQFYSSLYKPINSPSQQHRDGFLDNLPLPTLSKDHRELMEDSFSVEEVLDTIRSLKTGSAPGT